MVLFITFGQLKSVFLRIPKHLPAIGKSVSIAGRYRIGTFSRWTDYMFRFLYYNFNHIKI